MTNSQSFNYKQFINLYSSYSVLVKGRIEYDFKLANQKLSRKSHIYEISGLLTVKARIFWWVSIPFLNF